MNVLGNESRLNESLSLIDAVMPEVVATRQNQQNQQKQLVKTEGVGGVPTTSGVGGNVGAIAGSQSGITGSGTPSVDQNGEDIATGVVTASSGATPAPVTSSEGMEVRKTSVINSLLLSVFVLN